MLELNAPTVRILSVNVVDIEPDDVEDSTPFTRSVVVAVPLVGVKVFQKNTDMTEPAYDAVLSKPPVESLERTVGVCVNNE